MRVGSLSPIAKEREKSMVGFYVLACFGAIFIGIIILALWEILKKLFFVVVQYWYIAVLVVLVLLYLKRKRRKKKDV